MNEKVLSNLVFAGIGAYLLYIDASKMAWAIWWVAWMGTHNAVVNEERVDKLVEKVGDLQQRVYELEHPEIFRENIFESAFLSDRTDPDASSGA